MNVNIEPETENEKVLVNAIEQLADEVDDLAAENVRLRKKNEELEEELDDAHSRISTRRKRFQNLKNRVESRDSRIDEVRDDLDDVRGNLTDEIESLRSGIQHANRELEGVKQRLKEGDLADAASDNATDSSGPSGPEPSTPLQNLVALPDSVADEALATRVDERARWVASRVQSIGTKIGVGWGLTAGAIGSHLKTVDKNSHPETVRRIMKRIDELGGENVEMRYTESGEKEIVMYGAVEEKIDRIAARRKKEAHNVMNPQPS